jgi:hypothetical protein
VAAYQAAVEEKERENVGLRAELARVEEELENTKTYYMLRIGIMEREIQNEKNKAEEMLEDLYEKQQDI